MTQPAQAGTCTSGQWRGYDLNGDMSYSKDGVNSQLYVPPLGDLGNYNSYASGGDIYLIFGTNDFVQLGWVTNNGQTIAWTGERIPSWSSETLSNLPLTLTNAYHAFRILRDSLGYYDYYVDGNYVGRSNATHSIGYAGVTGEQDNTCGVMDNLAARDPWAPPYATLWWHSASLGWNTWANDDRETVNPVGSTEFHSDSVGGYTGTDDAWGGPA